jgi:1-acyl-sn-glycerol-3-phosphate acyltransferase
MYAGAATLGSRPAVWMRSTLRIGGALLLLLAVPLLAIPMPGRSHIQRGYCRMMLRALGVRITVSGGPIRNLRGVLVVSGHVSWLDIFSIGAVLPGSFVARADLIDWPAVGVLARVMKVIPIERESLRRLPAVVGAVAARLRDGQTVVAFPEGTTWCGLGYGQFRPAMFQAAVDAARPVQPLRLTYHHRDGRPSTVPAFIGEDSLLTSIRRLVTARRTVVHVQVQSLQLPGDDRRDLASRCEAAVRGTTRRDVSGSARGHAPGASAATWAVLG